MKNGAKHALYILYIFKCKVLTIQIIKLIETFYTINFYWVSVNLTSNWIQLFLITCNQRIKCLFYDVKLILFDNISLDVNKYFGYCLLWIVFLVTKVDTLQWSTV